MSAPEQWQQHPAQQESSDGAPLPPLPVVRPKRALDDAAACGPQHVALLRCMKDRSSLGTRGCQEEHDTFWGCVRAEKARRGALAPEGGVAVAWLKERWHELWTQATTAAKGAGESGADGGARSS